MSNINRFETDKPNVYAPNDNFTVKVTPKGLVKVTADNEELLEVIEDAIQYLMHDYGLHYLATIKDLTLTVGRLTDEALLELLEYLEEETGE